LNQQKSPEAPADQGSNLVQLASLEPMVPASVLQTPANVVKPKPEEKPAANALSINGFKLSGDFRFRADAQVRSGNDVAGPLQNVRARYRIRMNVDKDIDPSFK